MDIKKLAGDLLGIVKAAAPLVGLSEEVAAAEAILNSAKSAFENIKGALASDDADALGKALDEAFARVNAHADRTADSLG